MFITEPSCLVFPTSFFCLPLSFSLSVLFLLLLGFFIPSSVSLFYCGSFPMYLLVFESFHNLSLSHSCSSSSQFTCSFLHTSFSLSLSLSLLLLSSTPHLFFPLSKWDGIGHRKVMQPKLSIAHKRFVIEAGNAVDSFFGLSSACFVVRRERRSNIEKLGGKKIFPN